MADADPPKIDLGKVRREALSAWWSADYSVEGLKKRQVPTANGLVSLYDYWFGGDRAPRVVEFGGRSWTIFHLPMTDLEGNKSEKAGWSLVEIETFYAEIFWREQEGERAHHKSQVLREDLKPRVSFDGVVFPPKARPTISQTICPSYVDALFFGAVDLSGGGSNVHADLRNACFDGDVSFAARTLHKGADFGGARFLGHAQFTNARFNGEAAFARCQFWGQADFDGASFMGAPDLRDATFWDRARFEGGAAGGIILDDAKFLDKVSFRRREFSGPVLLRTTVFRADADFGDCTFEDTLYARATFHGIADFSSKNGGRFGAEVDFDVSKFLSDVDFSGREFLRSTRFFKCSFARAPQFFGATPHPSTSFGDCQFTATIGEAPKFEDMFGEVLKSWSRDGAVEEGGQISRPLGLSSAALSWIFRWVPFAEWLGVFARARKGREVATRKLEDSYRTARHLFEADGELAGRFYALEMDTRRNRRDVAMVERWLLSFFELSSGYGRYLGRALATLFGALLFVTALGLFALPHMGLSASPNSAGEVFAQVWRMFLLPAPFVQAADPAKVGWVAEMVGKYPVPYVLVSGFCALVTAGVVGVALVTLRRRFALK